MQNWTGINNNRFNWQTYYFETWKHNFRKNPNKLNYIYVLTPKGIAHKTKLTINFMRIKMKEYDELRKEVKK